MARAADVAVVRLECGARCRCFVVGMHRGGVTDTATLVSLCVGFALLVRPLLSLANASSALLHARAGAERLDELLDLPLRTVAESSSTVPVASFRLEGVDVGYGDRRVLMGVDVVVRRGELIAVTGVNGAGKSTLLRVCAGLMPSQEGTVSVGFEDGTVNKVRDAGVPIVWTSERPLLFSASVAQNIALFSDDADPSAMSTAAKMAQASHLLFASKPLENATNLSAGEQQKICLARAFYQGGSLWFLDDPTQALDARSAETVADSLLDIARNGGLLVVATHDEAILKRARRVLHLVDGKLVDETVRSQVVDDDSAGGAWC
ncbi:MAG: ATP-binding cassette domain-containing protein [Polyangiales bacterium]